MIDAGLIRESKKRTDAELDDERRIYYEITALGQQALAAELQRYRQDRRGCGTQAHCAEETAACS